MTGLYAKNQLDKTKEIDGQRFDYDLNSRNEQISFVVAREGGGNIAYNNLAEQVFKPHRRAIQHGKIDPVFLETLLAKLYAKTVIKSWEGVEDENNELLDFTEENCIKVLTDLPVLFDAIKEFARDYTQFLLEGVKEDAKN